GASAIRSPLGLSDGTHQRSCFFSGTMKPSSTLTIDTISAPNSADQNPSTCHPRSSRPPTHEVSHNIRVLMTSRNSPSVSTTATMLTNCTIGFTQALTSPNTSATTSSTTAARIRSSTSRLIPGTSHVATASAMALSTSRASILITSSIVPAPPQPHPAGNG